MPYSLTRALEPPVERVARLNDELRHASAHTIMRAAIMREFGSRICYVCSFGAQSAAMLAVIADIDPGLPVIFIDTGMHFRATLDYGRVLVSRLGLTDVRTVRPSPERVGSVDPDRTLWNTDPERCCRIRKLAPLEPVLEGFDAWMTGRKRSHGGLRGQLPVFEYSHGRFKVNPLIDWTHADVTSFTASRGIELHPLVEEGYSSIGCWPCSAPTGESNGSRAGRWSGRNRTECGLHLERRASVPTA